MRTAYSLFTLILFTFSLASAQTIQAPARVQAGASFDVSVSPLPPNSIVSIVKKGHKPGRGPAYAYFHKPPTAKLRAPDEPGEDYEIRLLEGHSKLITSRPITVEGVTATLDAPAQVDAGAALSVQWTGPNNGNDTIRLAEIGAAATKHLARTYPGNANPVKLVAPDKPGEYEIRYVTGQSAMILAARKITVGGTQASVSPPTEVEAGALLEISWEGPDNPGDVINVVPAGASKRAAWGYPGNGNPAKMTAPLQPGKYEARYQTGQSRAVLARAPLSVVPARQAPGKLAVTASTNGGLAGAAVEIILDASGSMLQRMGSERRIEIAKRTLTELTADVIPAQAPFALRVFGKEVDSCQTDLEIALSPLNASAVASKIGAIEAKNNAKTPIAASLAQVGSDLRAASGERVVILVTDGEETCGGDPAKTIAQLRAGGTNVRVNIVGFAIDDQALAETFADWTDLGGGTYFSANDAAALKAALSGALQRPFEVVDSTGRVVARGVAGDAPLTLPPGAYTVESGGVSLSVQVEAGKTVAAAF